jgi:hypothetical protein
VQADRVPPDQGGDGHDEDQRHQDEQFDSLQVPVERLLGFGGQDEHAADAGDQAHDEEGFGVQGTLMSDRDLHEGIDVLAAAASARRAAGRAPGRAPPT